MVGKLQPDLGHQRRRGSLVAVSSALRRLSLANFSLTPGELATVGPWHSCALRQPLATETLRPVRAQMK